MRSIEFRLKGYRMAKHLLLVGGGHAHMTVMKNIDRIVAEGHRVTVVSSSSLHYYSGMGPGMLSGIYQPEEIRVDVKKLTENRGGEFVKNDVVRIKPEIRAVVLKTGQTIDYDVVSFNIGSAVPIKDSERGRKNIFTVKPIEKLLDVRAAVIDALKGRKLEIGVAGGGPSGVELAGNLHRLVGRNGGGGNISLAVDIPLLDGFDSRIRKAVKNSFRHKGIELYENMPVSHLENRSLVFNDGSRITCDLLIYATGVKPSPIFYESGLPTGVDGGLLVNRHLQSVAHPEIFGGGDCISFEPRPLDKVGVYAVRQNPVLKHNLQAALNQHSLVEFVPQESYLLAFNMGDGTAILSWKNLLLNGRLGFIIKNYIDQRFMRSFQLSGERSL